MDISSMPLRTLTNFGVDFFGHYSFSPFFRSLNFASTDLESSEPARYPSLHNTSLQIGEHSAHSKNVLSTSAEGVNIRAVLCQVLLDLTSQSRIFLMGKVALQYEAV